MLRFLPIGLTLALVVAACGGSGKKAVTTTTPPQVQARVYFVRDGKVAPVLRTLPSNDPAQLLVALGRGPTPRERSVGFTSVFPRTSRLGLAQAIYTLTQVSPSDSFAYQGKTYRRSGFEDEAPAILVESPLPFATVRSPLRLSGTANTFEATFQYELKDAAGKVLAQHFVTATSGNGIRGTYGVSIPFTVKAPTKATLTAYEVSAENGSRVNQVDIPLTLEP